MSQIEIEKKEILEFVAAESTEISTESQGRIGKGPTRQRLTLVVHVPLTAQITRVKGYLRNAAWPDGCDMGSSDWREADLFNYHEPIGWAYAGYVSRGTTPVSQWVSATFVNWLNCNDRFGRLQVFYKLPGSSIEDVKALDVDPEIQGPILTR